MSYNPANLTTTANILQNNTAHLQFAPTRYIVPQSGQYVPNLMQAIGNGQRIPGALQQRFVANHSSQKVQFWNAFTKVLGWAEHLSENIPNNANKSEIEYWTNPIKNFFAEDARLRYIFLNSHTQKHDTYDLKFHNFAHFFRRFYVSDVISVRLAPGYPDERSFMQDMTLRFHKATFTYHYKDGSQVVHSGTLAVKFNHFARMSSFEFKTDKCTEYLPRDPKTREVKDSRKESGQSIEPYGIPKLVTEYLEIYSITLLLAQKYGGHGSEPLKSWRTTNNRPAMSPMLQNPSPPNIKDGEIKNEHISMGITGNDVQAPTPQPTPSPSGTNAGMNKSVKSPAVSEKRHNDGSGTPSQKKRRTTNTNGPKSSPRKQ
ncbi:9164_t:CDS:2 [Paraglomus occultum]|uniref:9164_t:CDS:1 n=1 Tax=Paraglomus occultum TaxID=144539 RepID=A0A9N8WCL6_9GLOM|nr:9164_t:CDS:2 [Paraglomus occultum]